MKRKPYRWVLYQLLRFNMAVFGLLPRRLGTMLGVTVGWFVHAVLPKERHKALAHLHAAYGDRLTVRQRKVLVQDMFVHFSTVFADLLKMNHASITKTLSWVRPNPVLLGQLNDLLREGKGVLIATAHFGNWELLAAYLNNTVEKQEGHYVVARRLYYERYNEILVRLRRRFGVQTLYRDASFKPILKSLKKGACVGILVDQDVDSIPGIFVDFFGKQAYTTHAVAKLAYLTGVPVFPVFLVKQGPEYELLSENLIWVDYANEREKEIHRLTQAYTAAIESVIRRYPQQWVWFHNRWKTQPQLHPQDVGLIHQQEAS